MFGAHCESFLLLGTPAGLFASSDEKLASAISFPATIIYMSPYEREWDAGQSSFSKFILLINSGPKCLWDYYTEQLVFLNLDSPTSRHAAA
jgi:hypothetical protein